MTREEIIRNLKYTMEKHKNDTVNTFDTNISVMCKDILDYFEEQEPCDDVVSRGVFEQVMWERDIAIEQLHELGYELGQKIEPCDDAISREDRLIDLANAIESDDSGWWTKKRILSALRNI